MFSFASSLGVENGRSVVELKPKEVLTLGGHSLNSCTGNLHCNPQKGVGERIGGGRFTGTDTHDHRADKAPSQCPWETVNSCSDSVLEWRF